MGSDDARIWLRENGYKDIAKVIDEIMEEWEYKKNSTRRNWWDILSGNSKGQSRTVAGRKFPVLITAQRRQGKKVTKNAIKRKQEKTVPKKHPSGRW